MSSLTALPNIYCHSFQVSPTADPLCPSPSPNPHIHSKDASPCHTRSLCSLDSSPDLSASFSAASPTSECCSLATSSDSAIDLHDDNSSTASGPIYVRQPGFDHHAHELPLDLFFASG